MRLTPSWMPEMRWVAIRHHQARCVLIFPKTCQLTLIALNGTIFFIDLLILAINRHTAILTLVHWRGFLNNLGSSSNLKVTYFNHLLSFSCSFKLLKKTNITPKSAFGKDVSGLKNRFASFLGRIFRNYDYCLAGWCTLLDSRVYTALNVLFSSSSFPFLLSSFPPLLA